MGTEIVSLREVRDALGRHVDAAHYRGDITVITKNGEQRAAIVPVSLIRDRLVDDTADGQID